MFIVFWFANVYLYTCDAIPVWNGARWYTVTVLDIVTPEFAPLLEVSFNQMQRYYTQQNQDVPMEDDETGWNCLKGEVF